MNGSAMSGAPTQYQHLHKFIPADAVPPIVARFESDEWPKIFSRDVGVLQPTRQLFE